MRILMRGAIDPLQYMIPEKFIIENFTGGNIGNMIFINAIARALLTDENTTIDYVNTQRIKLGKAYADYVNNNYDVFIIPLANAFKKTFKPELVKLTEFVKMLKIPCHVVGVGIQQMLHGNRFASVFPYNEDVKAFVCAILEKSPMLGLRGEMTADYLKDIGFVPEKDFTVIGCPSMFTYGDALPEAKHIELCESSVVSFNSKVEFVGRKEYEPFVEFTKRNMELFPNMLYVQQQIDDIRAIYLDTIAPELLAKKEYDISKAISFTNIPAWVNYFRDNVDFSFGSRIHGNVAAILGGVPAITVPVDKRVFELADYHNIPLISLEDIKSDTTLYDIYNSADFSSIHKGHKERFEHYHNFLNSLGLETIFDKPSDEAPLFDKILEKQNMPGVIKSYEALSDEEKIARYRDGFNLYKAKFKDKQQVIAEKNELIAKKNARINELKKERGILSIYRMKKSILKIMRKLGIKK